MNALLQAEPIWVPLLKRKDLKYHIMISMDRETLTLVATVIAVIGVVFLFREMNKAKQDVENLKGFSSHVMQRLNTPIQIIPTREEPEEEPAEEKKEE
jgi:hypothetical protein